MLAGAVPETLNHCGEVGVGGVPNPPRPFVILMSSSKCLPQGPHLHITGSALLFSVSLVFRRGVSHKIKFQAQNSDPVDYPRGRAVLLGRQSNALSPPCSSVLPRVSEWLFRDSGVSLLGKTAPEMPSPDTSFIVSPGRGGGPYEHGNWSPPLPEEQAPFCSEQLLSTLLSGAGNLKTGNRGDKQLCLNFRSLAGSTFLSCHRHGTVVVQYVSARSGLEWRKVCGNPGKVTF